VTGLLKAHHPFPLPNTALFLHTLLFIILKLSTEMETGGKIKWKKEEKK
jgi:hypothetical protein